VNHYRTIFMSDLHLGGSCNYIALLNFLKNNDADTWYFVGDIFDFWALGRNRRWPQDASVVVQKLLRKVRKGAKFIVVRGNHDFELEFLENMDFGSIQFVDKAVFTALDGRRFLVIHGDIFDPPIAKWLAHTGSVLYDLLVVINRVFNKARKLLGLRFWSLSARVKKHVKEAVAIIGEFRKCLIELSRKEGCKGNVIAGHIHTAALENADPRATSEIEEPAYFNPGDFVESMTAIGEHHDTGRFELLHCNEH
jgi:UDP-2,3-diacylglucosamine pyrophosphatase LpxH